MTGDARYRAIVNTYFSLSGSVLISYVMSMFVDPKKKFDMVIVAMNTKCSYLSISHIGAYTKCNTCWGCGCWSMCRHGDRAMGSTFDRLFLRNSQCIGVCLFIGKFHRSVMQIKIYSCKLFSVSYICMRMLPIKYKIMIGVWEIQP